MEKLQLQKLRKPDTSVHAQAVELGDGFEDERKSGDGYDATNDKRDMYRLGRRQELNRRFKYCRFHPHVMPLIVVVTDVLHLTVMTKVF